MNILTGPLLDVGLHNNSLWSNVDFGLQSEEPAVEYIQLYTVQSVAEGDL